MFRLGLRLTFRLVVATCSVGFVLAPEHARADPSAQEVASAKANLTEGRALAKANDHEGARRHFLAAWSLVPTPITGMEAARAEAHAGHLVEAREICVTIAKMPAAATEKAEHRAARSDAAALADTLRARIPSIILTLAEPSTEASVSLDGERLKPALLGATLVVNPGRHHAIVSVDEASTSLDFDIAEGERNRAVVLPLPTRTNRHADSTASNTTPSPRPSTVASNSADTSQPRPAPPSRPDTVPGEHRGGAMQILPWVIGGVGVATLGVAGGLALAGRARWNESNDSGQCVDDNCSQNGLDLRSDGRSMGDVATVLTVIGGAALATSVVLVILRPSSNDRANTSIPLAIGPGWVTLGGRF